ncbi:MAG: ABC-F family ATP-binding cassette domain-containing protein [Candidatus Marinimicrobia bacterium]|nr:ABC-F family ATP-binding cassette domain-containing protein [Candidatus Neomarinimicrobiota bacterium]
MSRTALISTHGISKSYGAHPLFEDISLNFFESERMGLIGPNGSGKSTLLKILAGIETPDTGEISYKRHIDLIYLSQKDSFDEDKTIEDTLFDLLPQDLEQWELDKRIQDMKSLIEFDNIEQKINTLSGGWRKRLAIGRALIQQPKIILMDEPTNHLDLEGILWLEKLLKTAPFAFILVSHDRYFLENATNRIVELNPRYVDGYIKVEGNYSTFIEIREKRLHEQAKHELTLSNKIRREVEWLKKGPKARTTKARFRIDKAHQLMGDLAELSHRNAQTKSIKIDFEATERKTKKLLEAKNLNFSRSEKLLFSKLDIILSPNMCMGIMGKNGSGKSSLLHVLNNSLSPDSGYINYADGLKIITFDQQREIADENQSLKEALVESGDIVTFRGKPIHITSWAKRFLFKPEQLEVSVSQLSGGEKARVLIANLMRTPADILLLDEPTNDLDIPTLEILEESLKDFPGAIVLISHDRYFIDRLCDLLLYLDDGEIKYFADYHQLYQYQQSPLALQSDVKNEKVDQKKLQQVKRQLKKDLNRIEGQIEKGENQVQSLKDQMAFPSNLSNPTKLEELYTELHASEEKLDILYSQWEELESLNG